MVVAGIRARPICTAWTRACSISDGQVVGAKQECFGVRTVRLERSPERFTYWLNERPVFIRGTSYMPALYLSQCDEHALAHDLALARDANLNLLRLHVHVSPPEVYDLCDRAGMLIWQDFELNWVHDPSPEFEARAVEMQRGMIDLLGNHPSIITWACHNEPTMVFARRANLERHPDPALYADAWQHDPTRPVFLCSGQLEDDWRRSGDAHTYYGAIWTRNYTDVYRHHPASGDGIRLRSARRARHAARLSRRLGAASASRRADRRPVGVSSRADPVSRRAFPPPARRSRAAATSTSGWPTSSRRSAAACSMPAACPKAAMRRCDARPSRCW